VIYIVKKVSDFRVPSRDVTNQTIPRRGIIKIANLFYSVRIKNVAVFYSNGVAISLINSNLDIVSVKLEAY
jgi:hypothetical protein